MVQSLLLVGCSGSGDSSFNLAGNDDSSTEDTSSNSDDSDDSDSSSDTEAGTSVFSFNSLAVYEATKEFSGADVDGVIQSEWAYPYIKVNMINPIIASSLASTTLAAADDFITTVDDIEIDASESFPVLQKIIGTPVSLKTALVFDVSGSVSQVDFAALIAEAKTYITAAQASSDSLIANQQYVIWAFGKVIGELTSGFTSDAAEINTALDLVVTRRNDTVAGNANSLGTQSNLHKAIVESIGRYKDDDYDFRDISTVEVDNNDLVDFSQSNGIGLSQMVLFSSGSDTFLEMSQSLMVAAIKSQGFQKFVSTEQIYTNKPVFYYVIGGTTQGASYSALSLEAESTNFLTLDGGEYDFSDGLIQNQINAVSARIDLDNQYAYRSVFLPRVGDHEMVFKSNSAVNESSITTPFENDVLILDLNTGTPSEELESMVPDGFGGVAFNGLVEITGPNGEYLSNYAASLAEVSTFLPATRWVSDEYDAGDYAWSFPGGDGVGTVSATGSYTVTSITGASSILRLENTVLGYTTDLTISN